MIRREIEPELVAAHARDLDSVFDVLWVVEDLPWAGGVSQLTSVLDATDRAMVGHGIAPTPFRNPVALAMEWATLARLHPGRLVGGLGHGVQDWMRSIGAAADSPLTLLEEQLGAISTLLAGKTLSVEGRYVRVDDVRLTFPPAVPIRVHAGVTGPKSLALSGRAADGTILGEGASPELVARARRLIDGGREAAGRVEDHRVVVFVAVHIGTSDELIEGFDESIWKSVHTDPNRVVEDLVALEAAGADSVVVVPIGRDPFAGLDAVGRLVVPALRAQIRPTATP
ncbi:MAG: LLM class flavin-dependent oxidoreductase [Acidimicrobiia bacterium]